MNPKPLTYPQKQYKNAPYFYHSDHASTLLSTGLGSSSFITDLSGSAVQHLQYMPLRQALGKPFGETFVNQTSTSWDARYKFTGKEKDGETGYSYFGARYYDSDISIWLSVDPMASKYPNVTPYAYVNNNPIMFIDRWGLEGEPSKYEEKKANFESTHKARHGRQLARYINRKGSKIGRSNAKYHRKGNYVGFDVGKSNQTVSYRKGRGPKNGGANISGPVVTGGAVYGGGHQSDGGNLMKGILTVGFTGTLSAGYLGGSFEIGIAFDGKDYSLYATLEHAVGADLSLGGIVNYHSPHNSNLSFSDAEGWGESHNGAIWLLDGTIGGNSLNSGLDPKNYSSCHTLYNTYGFGASGGLPIGYTINKGYTWYFLKF